MKVPYHNGHKERELWVVHHVKSIIYGRSHNLVKCPTSSTIPDRNLLTLRRQKCWIFKSVTWKNLERCTIFHQSQVHCHMALAFLFISYMQSSKNRYMKWQYVCKKIIDVTKAWINTRLVNIIIKSLHITSSCLHNPEKLPHSRE